MIQKLISIIIISAFVFGCQNKSTVSTKPMVTVSIVPQQFFVNQIAGNWLNVNVMIPPGASPAVYEPTPQQMMQLAKSQLYFKIGHIGFEKAWMEKLQSVNPNMKVVDTSEGLDLKETDHEHTGSDHDHGVNPHIWLNPEMVKHQANIIFQQLAVQYPDKKDVMQQNLVNFTLKCDSVQNVLNSQLADMQGAYFIVYHPVWTYLADAFGLHEISIEQNGKEATPNRLKEVIDLAKEHQIKVVFVQKEFNDAQAKTIANEINGNVVHLNPLAYNWFDTMAEFSEAFKTLNH